MRIGWVVAAMLLLSAGPSWAVLGEPVASLATDSERLSAELRTTAANGYSVYELTAPSGTTVRQFASPEGIVFGVAWSGPFAPELAPLLGSYFEAYRQAVQTPVRHHGPLFVRTDRLVIATGGHMRALHGSVCATALLPASLTAGVVR